jgi:hypothetical protein
LRQIGIKRGTDFSQGGFIKAHIYTWLALSKEPGLPFGTAITQTVPAYNAEPAKQFIDWISLLHA